MNNSKQRLYGLVTLAALTLITACETPEPKSSAANITQLTLTVGGEDKTVSFNDKREATLTHQYAFGQDAPTTAIVKSISLSSKATATVTSAGTLAITNNKASITVTAEDGTKLTYTIAFTFTQQSPFTTLVLTIGSQDNEVTFDQTQQATVAYQYPFGENPPTTATVKNIGTADNTTASVADGGILTITDNQVTITVTAQNGTAKDYTINIDFTQAPGSSAKEITALTLRLGGQDRVVTFDQTQQATVTQQYLVGGPPPQRATVQRISISDNAKASIAQGETLTIDVFKSPITVTITVTAQDNSTQDYTITFDFILVDGNTLKAITKLVIALGGASETVAFNNENEATIAKEFPFGTTLPTTFTVTEITVSPQATTTVSDDATITIADNKATITVTAQDGTTQTYTLNFNLTTAPNTAAAITTLVLTLGGVDKTVTFNENRRGTITHQVPSGEDTPTTATVKEIALSQGAKATVASNGTLAIAENNTATITVTAQDGTTMQTYTLQFTFTIMAPNTTAEITTLVLTLGGVDKTVTFDENRRDTVTHQVPFGENAPTTATVKEIALSQGAKATAANNGTLAIAENNTATITVTAQDGTTVQTYTLQFTFTIMAPNTAAAITTLVLTLGGVNKTVTFDENRRGTVTHQVPAGTALPTRATVKEIALSQGAKATVANNGTLAIAENNTATITVTAQDGTAMQTYTLVFELTQAAPNPTSLPGVLASGSIPANLSAYSEVARAVLAPYTAGATVVANYVTVAGAGTKDGSSWDNAADAENLKSTLDGIGDANSSKVYLLLVAAGSYDAGAALSMKDNVAIAGGWEPTGGWTRAETDTTTFSGGGTHRVVNNNGLSRTAMLYSVKITEGNDEFGGGGGMYNDNASPTLTNVTFSGNTTSSGGGGMANNDASPALTNVTFSGNTAAYGGGMFSANSSITLTQIPPPTLTKVTFSGNEATLSGGGMYNDNTSPTLTDVTFSGNEATIGGGMNNSNNASPSLTNVTFSGNTTAGNGGGMNNSNASPTLTNVTFSGNTAAGNGGGMLNIESSPILSNVTFIANTAGLIGGGMFNNESSPILSNVTFERNVATLFYGGGMYNNGNGQTGPVVVNCLFWGNTAPDGNAQIALDNYNGIDGGVESITLAYSVIQGGADSTALATTANGDPVNITATGIVTTDPMLGMLADNGGSVQTVAIASGSTAQNIGVYVRRSSDGTLYYSADKRTWYTSITAEGLADTATPPADAVDLTAADATGTARSGRPDAGAYEAR